MSQESWWAMGLECSICERDVRAGCDCHERIQARNRRALAAVLPIIEQWLTQEDSLEKRRVAEVVKRLVGDG